jgi:HSP20 family protein
MANLSRWDPFGEMLSLRDAMNQLFEESVVHPARTSAAGTLGMPLDLRETNDAFIVDVVVPGVKPEDLDISLANNVLTVSGETRQEQQTGDQQAHRVERRYGRFSRSVSLSTQVNADEVRATLENGILHLEIPKAEQVKPHKITVNTAGGQQSQLVDVQSQGDQGQSQGEQSRARGQ